MRLSPTRTLAAVAVATLAAATVAAPEEPGVWLEREGKRTRLDVVLPGELVDYALPTLSEGRRTIVLLVQPVDFVKHRDEEEEKKDEDEDEDRKADLLPPCPDERGGESEAPGWARRLYRVEPTGDGGLTLLRDDLSLDCAEVHAADLDGDGRDELLVARDGEILRFDLTDTPSEGTLIPPPTSLIRDAGVILSDLPADARAIPIRAGAPRVATVGLGSLRLYGPEDPGGAWRKLEEVALPVDADLAGAALELATAVPRFAGRRADGGLLLSTAPEKYGERRLRMLLIDVAESRETSVTESWARLPSPERLLETEFLSMDGHPVLLVTTMPANKIALFGEKRLRLFSLERDRSRLGIDPFFAVDSRMNLWQTASVRLTDVNGDGLEDLVVGYWKGIVDDKVVLDAYLRLSERRFGASPKTTAFNVEGEPDDWLSYGTDIDGDAVPDLLLRTPNALLLHPGLPSKDGKRLVSRTPLSIPLGKLSRDAEPTTVTVSTEGAERSAGESEDADPILRDVDGDGRREIVLTREGSRSRPGIFRVVWVGGKADE